ncbi:MAG: RHS repeat-associated core domain-containing protein [Candidatus Obscuribacterales bacterium]|nr:RHS repeat-associated core domain-containing protein [Candidatus Obscuribacterales bacterium]
MININYPGSSNFTTFAYDAYRACVEIIETRAGSITSTKQFVRGRGDILESRDSLSQPITQIFANGENRTETKYFYSRNHINSIQETTDSSGNIQSQKSYDPFGNVLQSQGSLSLDYGFGGYYLHSPSLLAMTICRNYSSQLGRWFGRDPIGELGGLNLYAHVNNSPVIFTDPFGLKTIEGGAHSPGGSTFCTPKPLPPWTPPNDYYPNIPYDQNLLPERNPFHSPYPYGGPPEWSNFA